MRRFINVFSLLLLCAGSGVISQTAPATGRGCADLHLVPAPRECTAVQVIPISGIGFFVTSEKNAEDQFAVEDLVENRLGKRTVREDAPYIRLERAESAPAQSLLASHNLRFDPAMHDEGYIIAVSYTHLSSAGGTCSRPSYAARTSTGRRALARRSSGLSCKSAAVGRAPASCFVPTAASAARN